MLLLCQTRTTIYSTYIRESFVAGQDKLSPKCSIVYINLDYIIFCFPWTLELCQKARKVGLFCTCFWLSNMLLLPHYTLGGTWLVTSSVANCQRFPFINTYIPRYIQQDVHQTQTHIHTFTNRNA